MALKAVLELVKNRLPFMPLDGSCDEKAEDFKLEQYYYLQSYCNISDADVEEDSSYTGLKRMLVADLVAYYLIVREVVKITGGEDGGAATGSKHIKKGKADVVEAEFEYSKASDGNTIAMETKKLVEELRIGICTKAQTIGFHLEVFCGVKKPVRAKPFKFFPNTNIR